ncbi:unnamed protein product [Lampetra fluviatilis]
MERGLRSAQELREAVLKVVERVDPVDIQKELERVCDELVAGKWMRANVRHTEAIPAGAAGLYAIGRLEPCTGHVLFLTVAKSSWDLRSAVREAFSRRGTAGGAFNPLGEVLFSTADSDLYVKWATSRPRLVRALSVAACCGHVAQGAGHRPAFEEDGEEGGGGGHGDEDAGEAGRVPGCLVS